MVGCVCSVVRRGWTQCVFLCDRIHQDATTRSVQGGTVSGIMEFPVPCVTICIQVSPVPETFRARQPRVLGSVGPHIHPASAHYGEGLPDALRMRHKLNFQNVSQCFSCI